MSVGCRLPADFFFCPGKPKGEDFFVWNSTCLMHQPHVAANIKALKHLNQSTTTRQLATRKVKVTRILHFVFSLQPIPQQEFLHWTALKSNRRYQPIRSSLLLYKTSRFTEEGRQTCFWSFFFCWGFYIWPIEFTQVDGFHKFHPVYASNHVDNSSSRSVWQKSTTPTGVKQNPFLVETTRDKDNWKNIWCTFWCAQNYQRPTYYPRSDPWPE